MGWGGMGWGRGPSLDSSSMMLSMRQGRISESVRGVLVTRVFHTCTAAERTEKPTSDRAR